VIGVEGEHEGRTFRVRARRGVVFASGGFGHDGDRLLSLLRGPVFGSGSVPTGRGDFLDIGADLGAETGNLTNGFYYQAVLDELVANGGAVRKPVHPLLPALRRQQPPGEQVRSSLRQ
jgi:3-oxosteroid 1-dehydrogenase